METDKKTYKNIDNHEMNFCPECMAALEQGNNTCLKCASKPDNSVHDPAVNQHLYQNPENLSLYRDMSQLSRYLDPSYRPPRRTPIYDCSQHYEFDLQPAKKVRLPKHTRRIINIAAGAVLLAVTLIVLFTVYLRPDDSAPATGKPPGLVGNNTAELDEITNEQPEQPDRPATDEAPATPESYDMITLTLVSYGYASGDNEINAAPGTGTGSQIYTVNLASTAVTIDGNTADLETFYKDKRDYFKLRAIARVLNGSGKQFDITSRKAGRELTLYKGKSYSPVGGAFLLPAGEVVATPAQWKVYLDGKQRTIQSYSIGNEHFFGIDDLMSLLEISAEFERPETGSWFLDNDRWYYTKPDGIRAKDEWQLINGYWYYFYSDGSMATGWLQLEGNWYYLKDNGIMAMNETLTIDGIMYNFNETGICTNP